MKKNEETSRNMKNKREISEDFHSFLSSHEKSSTIFRAYRCCCNFFRRIPRRFPCVCFRNVCIQKQSTTNFGVSPFCRRKVTIFVGRETQTHTRQGQPLQQSCFYRIINRSTAATATTTTIQPGDAPFSVARSLRSSPWS